MVWATPPSFAAGQRVSASKLQTLSDNQALQGGAWTAYTPVWTSSGTAPAIGNGTITGRYLQVGKTLFVQAQIIYGSSTTYGTGNYFLSLPSGVTSAAWDQVLASRYLDSGTAHYVLVGSVPVSTTTLSALVNAGLNWGAASPVTPGAGDLAMFTGVIAVV